MAPPDDEQLPLEGDDGTAEPGAMYRPDPFWFDPDDDDDEGDGDGPKAA